MSLPLVCMKSAYGRVLDSQFEASSVYVSSNVHYPPWSSVIGRGSAGYMAQGWRPSTEDDSWLQVESQSRG